MVASPTPTMPISSDSIRVMLYFSVPKTLDRAEAAIQPAVPPPTTTILRILPAIGTPHILLSGDYDQAIHYVNSSVYRIKYLTFKCDRADYV